MGLQKKVSDYTEITKKKPSGLQCDYKKIRKKTVGLQWDYMSDYIWDYIWDYGLLRLYMGLHKGLRIIGIIFGLFWDYTRIMVYILDYSRNTDSIRILIVCLLWFTLVYTFNSTVTL